MPFPKKSLNADESVALDLHPHWWYFSEPAAALLGVIIVGIIAAAKGPKGDAGNVLKILIIAGLVITGGWLLLRYSKWATTRFVITSQRVVFRTGVLGAGDLLIESGGEDGQSRYTDIRHPDRVQKLIHSQMESLAQRRAGYGPTPASGAGVDVADQLERLEGMLTRGTLTQEEFDLQKRKLLER